jgi:hypothetical protein
VTTARAATGFVGRRAVLTRDRGTRAARARRSSSRSRRRSACRRSRSARPSRRGLLHATVALAPTLAGLGGRSAVLACGQGGSGGVLRQRQGRSGQ